MKIFKNWSAWLIAAVAIAPPFLYMYCIFIVPPEDFRVRDSCKSISLPIWLRPGQTDFP